MRQRRWDSSTDSDEIAGDGAAGGVEVPEPHAAETTRTFRFTPSVRVSPDSPRSRSVIPRFCVYDAGRGRCGAPASSVVIHWSHDGTTFGPQLYCGEHGRMVADWVVAELASGEGGGSTPGEVFV